MPEPFAAGDSPDIPAYHSYLGPSNPEIAYAVVEAWDTRLVVEPAVVGGTLDIEEPAAGRRSCMALEAVVAACFAAASIEALAGVRPAALQVSRQRTLHQRH